MTEEGQQVDQDQANPVCGDIPETKECPEEPPTVSDEPPAENESEATEDDKKKKKKKKVDKNHSVEISSELADDLYDEEKDDSRIDCYYVILAIVLGAILLGVLIYFSVNSLLEGTRNTVKANSSQPVFGAPNTTINLPDALSAGEDERPGGGRGVFKTTAYIPTASTTTTTVAATTAAAQDSGSPVATTPNGTIASRMAPRRPRVRMPMPLPGQAPEAEVKAEVETEATPEVAETTVRPPQARIRGFPRTRMLPPRPPGA